MLGLIVLSGFIMYGFVYPIYTRLGCNCFGRKCMPSKEEMAETDHIIDEPQEIVISDSLLNALMTKVDTLRLRSRPKSPSSQGLLGTKEV